MYRTPPQKTGRVAAERVEERRDSSSKERRIDRGDEESGTDTNDSGREGGATQDATAALTRRARINSDLWCDEGMENENRMTGGSRPRSPPTVPSEMETVEMEDDEELARPSKKRRARGSPPVPPTKTEPSALLMNMKSKIDELIAFGKRTQNAHKEVKRLAAELGSLAYRCITENKHEKSIRTSLEMENRALRERSATKCVTADTGCQTESYTPVNKKVKEDDRIDISSLKLETPEDVKMVLNKAEE